MSLKQKYRENSLSIELLRTSFRSLSKRFMAIHITDACINCGACEPECPNNAIYEGAATWRYSEGTTLENLTLEDGTVLAADAPQAPLEDDFFFIVSDKCTECVGHFDEPQCAAVCPVDCCLPDLARQESEEKLEEKYRWLQG